jgi:hypothetical protein
MENNSDQEVKNARPSIWVPVAVYLSSYLLPAIVLGIPTLLFNWTTDYTFTHSYIIATLGQLLMDIPAVFMFARLRDAFGNEAEGRNKTRDRVISAVVGLSLALLFAAPRLLAGRLMGGAFMGGVPAFTQSLQLASPWNMIAGASALLAYGPGEALFVVYLILAFDKAVGNPRRLVSWGVIITAILWALPHIFNVVFFGMSALGNVVVMVFIGIVMGILLKKTRSSIGPMVFWLLVNGTSA